jgi:bile acid:Na+ symporter, BASS family
MTLAVDIATPLITFILLTGVGLELTRDDFVRVLRSPRLVLAGLAGPLVLLPPLALLLIAACAPPPNVQAGLLLVAICPIGGISNTYSYLARASTALSVTLTGLSCLLATITIPVLAVLFERLLGRPLGVEVPARLLLAQLFGVLAAPIATGMAIRRFAPGFASRHDARLRQAAFAALGLLIVVVVWQEAGAFLRDMKIAVTVSAGFVLLSGCAGLAVARFVARSREDRFTLAAEFATRNLAIATAVAVTLAGRLDLAVFATTYFLTEAPIMLAAVAWFRRR